MGRSTTSSFTVTRRFDTEPWHCKRLDTMFDAGNKLYNTGSKHYQQMWNELRDKEEYQTLRTEYREAEDQAKKEEILDRMRAMEDEYDFSEYAIQHYLNVGYNRAYKGCLYSDVVENLGSSLYKSVSGAIQYGTQIHYRKMGQTNTLEEKKADSGFIYKEEQDAIQIHGRLYPLVPIRKKDYYLQEAMTHRIKYCRIIRKPFKSGYRYFVQFVMEGKPPIKDEHLYPTQKHKHTLGKGTTGLDEGTSTAAYYGNGKADFVVLADGVEKYNAAIADCAREYERKVRLNNPECYRKDGSRIKGRKNTHHTKGMRKALMALKNAYRKKSAFVKQQHNILANAIIAECDTIVKEEMDFKALAKRSQKPAERQEKESTVVKKNGEKQTIRKYKKKRRFGKTVNNRSPGLFNSTLERKMQNLGGKVIDVDSLKYKASQYNHLTREAVKMKLSDRSKWIGDTLVQRDLYSAFLLSNRKTNQKIDFDKCNLTFPAFLEAQDQVVERIKQTGDKTKNFGLKDFINQVQTA